VEVVRKRSYKPGEVLVIRYEGPKGGPGMRRCWASRRSYTVKAWAKRSHWSLMGDSPERLVE
jgi:dihydroxyacid dehydratase/phosphogluconate dehydratase